MKDVSHHLRSIQKKIIRTSRRETQKSVNHQLGPLNGTALTSGEMNGINQQNSSSSLP